MARSGGPQSNQRGIETQRGPEATNRHRTPQSNQRGIETRSASTIQSQCPGSLNRTSVGLKQGWSSSRDTNTPVSLNRTSVGLKHGIWRRRRSWGGRLNRTSVGLKRWSGTRKSSLRAAPQSNQRGIETKKFPSSSARSLASLNRTSVGLKQWRVACSPR